MPDYIASYDLRETIPSPHAEFLKQAVKQGWKLWILGTNGIWYRLPNTTLFGVFRSEAEAVAALEKTRAATQIALGRLVSMPKWIVSHQGEATLNSDQLSRTDPTLPPPPPRIRSR